MNELLHVLLLWWPKNAIKILNFSISEEGLAGILKIQVLQILRVQYILSWWIARTLDSCRKWKRNCWIFWILDESWNRQVADVDDDNVCKIFIINSRMCLQINRNGSNIKLNTNRACSFEKILALLCEYSFYLQKYS